MKAKVATLRNIEAFVEGGGHISLGPLEPFDCVAAAADDSNSLAMLVRRKGETLDALLVRLDSAIELANSQVDLYRRGQRKASACALIPSLD